MSADKKELRRLLRYGRPYRMQLSGAGALVVLSVGMELLKPWPLKLLIDNVLRHIRSRDGPSWARPPSRRALVGSPRGVACSGTLLLSGRQ